MVQSPRLALSYVAPSQAQKHVSVNESFRLLDILVQTSVRSMSRADEPEAPAEGDAYILPGGAAGESWAPMAAGSIAAFRDGFFAEIVPVRGHLAYVEDRGELVLFAGKAGWVPLPAGRQAPIFGVNTQADAYNKLCAKTDSFLLSHDDVTPGSGDVRQIVNKAAAGNSAALLFQTGYSGRAEIGLMGDDMLSVKVSSDGSKFTEMIVIDAAGTSAGAVAIAHRHPRCTLDVAGPVGLGRYTLASLPDAAARAGQIVYLSDGDGNDGGAGDGHGGGGPTLAFSDGTVWRRASDNGVIGGVIGT